MYAFGRMLRVRNLAALRNIDKHGRRLDESSKERVSPERTKDNLAWSSGDDHLDVVGAFKSRKAVTGAQEYKGASLALHFLIGVSPEWIAAGGDAHDPKNPRNRELFEHARRWADETFGEGACVAARMDMDEKGSGVVDLVVVPVAESTTRGKTKTLVSVNKGLERAWGKCKSYSALQDSWSQYAKRHLDPALERGKPKAETGADHVHARVIAKALEDAKKIKRDARKEARKVRNEAVKQWENAKDWPWRDREKIAAAAYDQGQDAGAALTRKKAIKALREQKTKLDEEKSSALAKQKLEHDESTKLLKIEVENARASRDEAVAERDAIAFENDDIKKQNSKLKKQVSFLTKIINGIRDIAPDPVKRVLSQFSGLRNQPAAPIGDATPALRAGRSM